MQFEISKSCKIECNGKEYSYEMIRENIERIKSQLPADETRIGIIMEHNENYVFGVLALLEADKTYVPISSTDPIDRINYILDDCGIKTILADRTNADKFSTRLVVEELCEETVSETVHTDIKKNNDEAYVLYTSGTTGKPKGVLITRDNLRAFIEGIQERTQFDEDTVALYHTAYTFDISFLESLVVLFFGGKVVIASEEEYKNPKSILSLIDTKKINTLQCTPSKLGMLIKCDADLRFLYGVRLLMIGGEMFPNSLLKKLQEYNGTRNNPLRILNMYGPTETTIWSTVSDLTYEETVNIGEPIRNSYVYIVDDNHNIVPDGIEGEIFIAGDVVGKEYINRKELSNEKFVEICVDGNPVRGFLTGDLGKVNNAGKLECFNRKDNQVKINGLRIELEEIESVIRSFRNELDCAVIKVDKSDSSELVICLCERDIDLMELKKHLDNKLPAYMVPHLFYYVKEIPYTSSGKLNRKRLVELFVAGEMINLLKIENASEPSKNNTDDVQEKINQIIKERIENPDIEINMDDQLDAIGINSIIFIDIIVTVEEEYDIEFDEDKLVLSEFLTYKDFLIYVKRKIAKK